MKTVVVPMETKSRELYGKLWLSLNLVSNDIDVILGDKRLIRKQIFNLDPDFYIAVGAGSGREETFEQLSGRVKIGVLDTEGAVFQNQDSLIKRYSARTLEHVDIYFSWGRRQSELMESAFSGTDVDIISAGNPRFDLLHSPLCELYSPTKSNILNMKPYSLIITNFSGVNHYRNTSKRWQSDKYCSQKQMLNEFVNATKNLANRYNHWNFVIRPHPSESHETYEKYFLSEQNISVNYSGDIREWIYSAIATIHAGSTAGIESRMMNTHTIGYVPIDGYTYPPLPMKVSSKKESIDELLSAFNNICEDNQKTATCAEESSTPSVLCDWFSNAKEPVSAEVITKAIKNELNKNETKMSCNKSNVGYIPKALNLVESTFYTDTATTVLKYNQKLINSIQKNIPLDFSQYPSLSGQRFQMFPGTSVSELEDIKNRMCEYSCVKNNVLIKQIAPWADLYRLKKQ